MSRIPTEWGDSPTFIMGNVAEYRRLATEPYFDKWLRLWFFTKANVHANGHLPLKRGDLRQVLGGLVDGLWQPADTDTVTNAIKLAKEKGVLDPASRALCLIPVRMIVAQGKGDPSAGCPRCHRGRKAPARRLCVAG